MFENYSNIYNDSNKYANYGVSHQEKKFLKKSKQQNKQNKYGLSSFSNSTINNHIGGLDSNIEAFGGMNQTQFLERFQNQQTAQPAQTSQTAQTMQSPQTLSGMNFGSPPPNPYPTNSSNMQNVSIQQINNQIQTLSNQNKLQAYNPKNPSNNVTTYANQSEAVLSQTQLTDADILKLLRLTSEYDQLIQQYNQAQTSVMNNADNQVLSMNSTTNPYLGQNLEISGGQVYYITNAGIAQPYEFSPTQVVQLPSSDFFNAGILNMSTQVTNTPTNVNSTSAINATVYDSAGTNYINTTPAMEIGNTKYQFFSSGYEGTNVYTNNSQPLSFTDASFQGCFNATISNGQQSVMSLAPGGLGGNYTFQTCQQVAYDSGSQFFSFNVSSPTSQTGNCYLSNSESPITQQGPALNYTYTQLWSSNITNVNNSDMCGNYMGIDPLGNIVIYNSSNSAIWSSDGSLNSGVSNFVGCYQDTILSVVPNTVQESRTYFERTWWGGERPETETIDVTQYNDVRNPINVSGNSADTWETCYQTAYSNGDQYFGVGPYNPSTSTTTCYLSTDLSNIIAGGGSPNSCQNQIDGINYGSNGSVAVYSSTTAPLNTFLTLQNSGIVSAFNGTSLFDVQNVTWQLDMSGQQQMSNYYIITTATYSGSMQTGQTLQNGQTFCSPSANIFFIMQGGNLVLYTSSNTPKCYGMTTNQNQLYYTGDISMNALYQMSIPINQFETIPRSNPEYLGNIGYVDENSVLYQYPQNLVGQGNTFTYMGNYDSSGTPITNTSNGTIYWTGLDLSGAMQQCIDFSCNAFIMFTNNNSVLTKFMQTAFGTPTYSQSSSNYLPRYPNPNAQFYLRNPTVNNSPYCNKSITGINSGLTSNYQTNGQMNANMQCVQITTTDPQLKALGQQINNLSGQINTMQTNLMKKTMTVNQQQQLNEIVLGRQFKEIDAVQAVQKQSKQNAVNAQNIKNDSNIVVLRENQSYTLWSVLAISIALISIHVIR